MERKEEEDEGKMGAGVNDSRALQYAGERERDEKGKLTKAKESLIYFIQWILKRLKSGA